MGNKYFGERKARDEDIQSGQKMADTLGESKKANPDVQLAAATTGISGRLCFPGCLEVTSPQTDQ